MALSRASFGMSSSSERSGRSERLTAEEEKDMARRIRRAEEAAREAIREVPAAQAIVGRRPERVERTRAGAVSRLAPAGAQAARAHGRRGVARGGEPPLAPRDVGAPHRPRRGA